MTDKNEQRTMHDCRAVAYVRRKPSLLCTYRHCLLNLLRVLDCQSAHK